MTHHTTWRAWVLTGLLALAAPSPQVFAEVEATHAPKIPDAPGVDYAAEVSEGLIRGSQPSPRTIAWLKQRGVKTVLNLRRFHGKTERERVLSAGMRYEHLPLEASDPPSQDQITRFLSLVTDDRLKPIYVHCAQGVDRTGTMMAIYRMEIEGWSNQAAFAEMKYFGANRIWWDLRKFVRNYQKRAPSAAVAPSP